MRRGTTPTHTFKSPIDLTSAEVIYLTYKHEGKVIIERSKEDIEVTEAELKITLDQTETLMFSTIGDIEIQCRARFPDGTAIASNIMKVHAGKILKEGII